MRYMGYLVFERLGGARTTLVVYDTIHGTCQKELPAEASNDGLRDRTIVSFDLPILHVLYRHSGIAAAADEVVALPSLLRSCCFF